MGKGSSFASLADDRTSAGRRDDNAERRHGRDQTLARSGNARRARPRELINYVEPARHTPRTIRLSNWISWLLSRPDGTI
jgi:hypothetical protein